MRRVIGNSKYGAVEAWKYRSDGDLGVPVGYWCSRCNLEFHWFIDQCQCQDSPGKPEVIYYRNEYFSFKEPAD